MITNGSCVSDRADLHRLRVESGDWKGRARLIYI